MFQKISAALIAMISVAPAFALNDPTKILDADALKDGLGGKKLVDPCDNFYEFACGSWIEKTPVPPSDGYVYRQSQRHYAIVDQFFTELLQDQAQGKIKYPTKNSRNVTTLYKSCVDTFQDQASARSILQKKIKQIETRVMQGDVEFLLADLHREGVNALFAPQAWMATQGEKIYILNLFQGGFNFADRSSYEPGAKILKQYATHIKKVLMLLGYKKDVALRKAKNIIQIETKLAKAALPLESAYDPELTTHMTDAVKLSAEYKAFDFSKYISSLGIHTKLPVNLAEPKFMEQVNSLFAPENKIQLRDYLQWQAVLSNLANSDSALLKEKVAFWDKIVDGLQAAKTTPKHCLDLVYGTMGDALGEVFVKTIETEKILAATESMIGNMKEAFVERIMDASQGPDAWLTADVAKRAISKVAKISQLLGASQTWKDYSGLKLNENDLLSNMILTKRRNNEIAFSQIGKGAVVGQIDIQPWAVDAYYEREKNHFVLPFGILMPPSFDLDASEGANLGSLGGGTIGHEMMHGFDDDGRKYDEAGNLVNWWDETSIKNYQARTTCIAEQTSQYPLKVGGEVLHINGAQTVTEDAADQNGMEIGRRALENSLKTRAPAPLWLGKYNELQQYWIGYAQAWCANLSPETVKSMIATGEHSPAEYRVNGVMMNSKAFSQDFGCRANAKMNPAKKCTLW